ncbi:MAG: helix-turn-helix domain-containing protein [Patescibacteria group bacterium]|nr:helix-turn-helix domain-containing protein [Patescibacteria group bacterium]
MAMNYEYDRHIRAAQEAGNEVAARMLTAQQTIFNGLVRKGILQELPLETRPIEVQEQPQQSSQETQPVETKRFSDGARETLINQEGDAGTKTMTEREVYPEPPTPAKETQEHYETYSPSTLPAGCVIWCWRQHQELTQEKLRRRMRRVSPLLPTTKGYISQVERDIIHQPGDDYLRAFAHALGLTMDEIEQRRLPPSSERLLTLWNQMQSRFSPYPLERRRARGARTTTEAARIVDQMSKEEDVALRQQVLAEIMDNVREITEHISAAERIVDQISKENTSNP